MSDTSFAVTQRLVNYLKVLVGSQVSLTQVSQINSGELDLLVGSVVSQNYVGGNDQLSQVTMQLISQGTPRVTLSCLDEFKLDPQLLKLAQEGDLLNRPRTVYASNLNEFKGLFQKSVQFGFPLACSLNRVDGRILQMTTLENEEDVVQFGQGRFPAFASTGPTGDSGANNPPPPTVP